MMSSLWRTVLTVTRSQYLDPDTLLPTEIQIVDGIPVAPSQTTFQMRCSCQEPTGDQMAMFPEGRKSTRNRVTYGNVVCQVADEKTGAIADTTVHTGYDLVAIWSRPWGEGNLAHVETGWASNS